ncbi:MULTISPECIES: M99 family carboxypeptidase catalytic domain-containing protein [unclassified Campylobacter]|uniref:M99 family carboxypeptidase catalytic domain-containing protein n=1 Tax=unclassified Campylobacter TaxID=2593542 RepID=UPI0012382370|nr:MULTISPECIES: M99 family carboxypeptidase catalytic domain-containing protein [unclassified Campylobacter]KAA6224574.1 deacylase [Campylobacter sp. LR185c]KAA6224921.1 deacylase [Campylobacter sp. LR196d]KAA6225418.1 deacylase [Campylobacter sp. LR286c]KAA6229122.1 deacylase [Campylobacter sp. LR291e]KAA8603256.1 deacylase [Campylobacter sp. LR185c]
MRYLIIFFSFTLLLGAEQLDFTVGINGKNLDDNNTVLIFGGIQGDEPGGFHAASLLLSDYTITKGEIIVAPNLAFDSIIKRSRGTNGDLNRKFANISPKDPDYKTVTRIKELINLPEVGMVINLHDGWGFYRPNYIDAMKNPNRWGNSSVIDTKEINASKYHDLEKIAQQTVKKVNASLIDPKHAYYLKNTKTDEVNDTEMLKALTYYVISNNKAAFANEASKNLPVHVRAYYHLIAVENYLKTAGIEFTRDFDLSPQGVKEAIEREVEVKLFDGRTLLYLRQPRPIIKFVPFPINSDLTYDTNNELIAVVAKDNAFYIQYGNNFQAHIYPEYLEFSYAFDGVDIKLDGLEMNVPFATKVRVKENFLIPKIQGVRVNVIGFNYYGDESNIIINKSKMQTQYSLDKAGKIYRVEFYELRSAKLPQLLEYESGSKFIKNTKPIDMSLIQKAGKKDKFLGSILVEFE